MPKVSVIVPVYGVEKYIERCARSLFEQTLDDIEYLFIDDCTPDRSIDILQQVLDEYPQRKPQVVIHRMEKNSGQAAVRKWGMQNATGEYVIHCDSDDWVDTDMYRAMYEKAKEEEADVVVCDYYISDTKNKNYKRGYYSSSKEEFLKEVLGMRASWALWNKLVKKNVLNISPFEYPKDNMGEDMAVVIQILLGIDKVAFINQPYYYYYDNATSVTRVQKAKPILRRFQQYVNNVQIVEKAVSNNNAYQNRNDLLFVIKWHAKRIIWPAIKKSEYFAIWKNTFSEINKYVIISTQIPVSEKLKFLLSYLRFYPWAHIN